MSCRALFYYSMFLDELLDRELAVTSFPVIMASLTVVSFIDA
jgi:hypothetical protein